MWPVFVIFLEQGTCQTCRSVTYYKSLRAQIRFSGGDNDVDLYTGISDAKNAVVALGELQTVVIMYGYVYTCIYCYWKIC